MAGSTKTITCEKLRDNISTIDDLDFLYSLLNKETRKTATMYIEDRIRVVRVSREDLIDVNLLQKLVNDVPFGNSKYKRTKISESKKKKVFERDNHTCQLCRGLISNNIRCHHIIPNGPASYDNLITLCSVCHLIVHIFLSRKGYKSVYSFTIKGK